MTRTEHLLSIVAEECSEVAQRATKALRFGLHETQPGQSFSNAVRIMREYYDLVSVLEMLQDDGELPTLSQDRAVLIENHGIQIEKYLSYSRECGTLQESGTANASPMPNSTTPEATK